MYCSFCGSNMTKTQRFCRSCGNNLSSGLSQGAQNRYASIGRGLCWWLTQISGNLAMLIFMRRLEGAELGVLQFFTTTKVPLVILLVAILLTALVYASVLRIMNRVSYLRRQLPGDLLDQAATRRFSTRS